MTKLDKTDLMILQTLQNDAKTSMKTLADALHLSKTPVYERIRRLEKEGIIKRYVALVDPEKNRSAACRVLQRVTGDPR